MFVHDYHAHVQHNGHYPCCHELLGLKGNYNTLIVLNLYEQGPSWESATMPSFHNVAHFCNLVIALLTVS